MKADIESVRKFSRFVDYLELQEPLNEFETGCLYVRAESKEMKEAISKSWTDIQDSTAMKAMNRKLDIKFVGKECWKDCHVFEGKHVVLRIFTPDRLSTCLLSIRIPSPENSESLLSFMIMDAYSISEKCAEAAINNLINLKNENFMAGIVETVYGFSNPDISFTGRGGAHSDPFSFLKSNKTIPAVASYSERIENIHKLPVISKKIRMMNTKEEGDRMYVQLWLSLTERERCHLFYELLKQVRGKTVKDIVSSTIDREELGKNTRFYVEVARCEGIEMIEEYGSLCKYCIFLNDKIHRHIPLKLKKSAQTIYTMALILKAQKPQKKHVLDILNNKDAFVCIYSLMFISNKAEEDGKHFLDNIRTEAESSFQKLSKYITSTSTLHSGRLPEVFREIEHALNEVFLNLDENPSPFYIGENTPLELDAERIILPPEFKKIQINAL